MFSTCKTNQNSVDQTIMMVNPMFDSIMDQFPSNPMMIDKTKIDKDFLMEADKLIMDLTKFGVQLDAFELFNEDGRFVL